MSSVLLFLESLHEPLINLRRTSHLIDRLNFPSRISARIICRKHTLFTGATALIEIVGGFLNRIEGDPVPPEGYLTLFAGELDRCISMVFITILVFRVKGMFRHDFYSPFSFGASFGWLI
jgi:hypothetical protein